jgi:hypothetical protein
LSDYTTLTLGVQSWSQAVSHGEQWPPRQLRCIARTSGEEELRLTGGPNIRTLDFHLLISRGEYVPGERERALERGIGILAFAEEREPQDDIPGSEAFCHGWWWMPETLYDETWEQVRGQTWQECRIEIDIAPIEYDTLHFHWDVKLRKVIYITRATVRFNRRKPQLLPPPDPPKRRGLFG